MYNTKLSLALIALLLALNSCDLFNEEPLKEDIVLTSGMVLDYQSELQSTTEYNPPIGGGLSIPNKFDLSQYMPPVGDQKSQSSCVSWTLGYYLQSYHQQREFGHSYSDATLMSPSFLYNQTNIAVTDGQGSCDSAGSRFIPVLKFLKNTGITTILEMPYNSSDCVTQPNQTNVNSAYQNRIKDYNSLFFSAYGIYNKNATKRLNYTKLNISEYKPVAISYEIDNKWASSSSLKNYSGSEPFIYSSHTSNPNTFYHASLIVGYDDDLAAFKVINSWGDDWANNGYFWISYDFFLEIVLSAFVVEDYIDNGSNSNCSNSFVDQRDGQDYCYVTIGNQIWMAENLNYNPGGNNIWCYDNTNYYCSQYGVMYSWEAAMNGDSPSSQVPSGVQGICPNGWHLPSKYEFQVLLDNYSNSQDAYTALIDGGTSGFNALNGGRANLANSTNLNYFVGLNSASALWSSTQNTNFSKEYLNYTNIGNTVSLSSNHEGGLYCRCIQD